MNFRQKIRDASVSGALVRIFVFWESPILGEIIMLGSLFKGKVYRANFGMYLPNCVQNRDKFGPASSICIAVTVRNKKARY